MKTTISVPDDLWAQALAASQVGRSPSAVVQDALRRSLPASTPSPTLDDETAARMEEAQRKLTTSAKHDFERGYGAGIHLADAIGDWKTINEIVQRGLADTIQDYYKDLLGTRREDGTYPPLRESRWSVFARDLRTEPLGELIDDDVARIPLSEGTDTDPDHRWIGWILLDETDLVMASPDGNPLVLRGSERALRDLLERTTP